MRVETICTGDELLTGLTSDTNSRHFQERLLATLGLTVRRSVVVGDVREDIIEALDAAAARCDVVLVSGGLGPTADDITAECAAQAAGVPLVESSEALAHIHQRLTSRGMTMTENNRRPAQVPQGAEVVLNQVGSAPGIIQTRGRCTLFFVPGVPVEYRHLVDTMVLPRIARLKGSGAHRVLRVLKTVGMPESYLDQRMRPLALAHPRVTFGYRTHFPENHLKLLAEAPTREEAQAAVSAAEQAARTELAEVIFGADDDTFPGVIVRALAKRGHRLAVAESCTGGLIAQLLTSVPGASDVLYGSAVTYSEGAKHRWAQVPEGLLAQFGAVSEETAEAMATGVKEGTGAQWALSVTGYAGPGGGTPADPVGTVYVGVSTPAGGPASVTRLTTGFTADRERVQRWAAFAALDLLRRSVESWSSP